MASSLDLGERRCGRASYPRKSSDRNRLQRIRDPDRPIVALAPHWRENRLTRTLYPGRLRSSAQNYRPAPRRYDFVRIVIDMGRLRALMPLDAPAEANPKITRETPRETPREGRRSAGRKKDTKLLQRSGRSFRR